MSQLNQPTISVSLARKINMGNYEPAEVFCSLSGITEGMTETEMDGLLETGAVAYNVLRRALKGEIIKTIPKVSNG